MSEKETIAVSATIAVWSNLEVADGGSGLTWLAWALELLLSLETQIQTWVQWHGNDMSLLLHAQLTWRDRGAWAGEEGAICTLWDPLEAPAPVWICHNWIASLGRHLIKQYWNTCEQLESAFQMH